VSAVEVAAAVIQRADGAFLLARRPAGKVYAGYWEFPGGKVEPGERVDAALARELHEELGIDIDGSYPWLTRLFTYPHATVRLNFRRVLSWKGDPHPREKQGMAWQRLDAPMAQPMLPANAPVLASLALPAEYAITDAARLGVPRMLERLEQRLGEGLRMIQVREPAAPWSSGFEREAIALAHRHGARVLSKQANPEADGIHFTAAQLMNLTARPQQGLAAASCHTREELEHAMRLGLDFAVAGPVKATASHAGVTPLGWGRFAACIGGASLPIYAIGGMDLADLERAWQAGGHGVAMIRGAWEVKNGSG
jgi:8-oxo-dGTP diphosphatase